MRSSYGFEDFVRLMKGTDAHSLAAQRCCHGVAFGGVQFQSVLNEHQLHTLLECPCPTIAPLAIYTLPGEVPFGYNAYIDGITYGPDGNIWVVESDANKIARVTASGTITEFLVPAAGAYPAQIAPGPDGNLWFTEFNFNTIGRITTEGVITEFALPPPLAGAPQNLYGIAAGLTAIVVRALWR